MLMELIQDSYKDTKTGKIPKDWKVVSIGSVTDSFGGTTPSTIINEYWNGDILWATPTDITSDKSIRLNDTSRKITEEGRKSKNLKYVPKNGLLMTSRASIGFVKISNGNVTTNQGFINIVCKNQIHYKYLYFWIIQNRGLLVRLSQGSTFLELYRTAFKKFRIPLPSLPEQQKIAEILSTVDEQISTTDRIIEKSKELKKGLMQKLFSEGIGHSHFSSPEGSIFRKILGHIPSSWEVKELSEIAEFKQGVQVNVELQETEPNDENIRFIRIVDYTQDNEDIRYVSNALSKYVVQAEDIVMVRYGTPGVIGRGIEGVIANNMFKISLDNKILLNDFFDYFFNQNKIKEYLLMGSGSSTMPALNFSYLRKFQIAIPTIQEQQKIAEILLEADKKIEKEEQYKSELEQLKKGLMQQLLTGQKRVKV